jgi:hypothetical protein
MYCDVVSGWSIGRFRKGGCRCLGVLVPKFDEVDVSHTYCSTSIKVGSSGCFSLMCRTICTYHVHMAFVVNIGENDPGDSRVGVGAPSWSASPSNTVTSHHPRDSIQSPRLPTSTLHVLDMLRVLRHSLVIFRLFAI